MSLNVGQSINSMNNVKINMCGPKPFKFIKGWIKSPNFKSILKDSWDEEISGNPDKW